MSLQYRPFDADNHDYESLDSFTRHQPPAMKRRGVQIPRDNLRDLLGEVMVSD